MPSADIFVISLKCLLIPCIFLVLCVLCTMYIVLCMLLLMPFFFIGLQPVDLAVLHHALDIHGMPRSALRPLVMPAHRCAGRMASDAWYPIPDV